MTGQSQPSANCAAEPLASDPLPVVNKDVLPPFPRGGKVSWRRLAGVAALGLLTLAGCWTTRRQWIEQSRWQYHTGDWQGADESLQKALKRPRRDESVLKLDQAMVRMSQGDLAESVRLFQDVRDDFASQPVGLAWQNASSYLTDDNTRPYLGEDHEKILLSVLLTIADWVRGGGDAVAYAHQMGDSLDAFLTARQAALSAESSSAVSATAVEGESGGPAASVSEAVSTSSLAPDALRAELAIAPFLRGLVRGESRLQHDDVVRNLQQALEWRSDSPFLMREYLERLERREPPVGFGRVYVIALVGRGPVKVAAVEPVSTQVLAVADRILSALGKYSLPPTIAPVTVAKMVPATNNFEQLGVEFNGQSCGSTETVADIEHLAMLRQAEQWNEVLARAVVRRVVKKSVIVATKARTGATEGWSSLAYNVAGVLWEGAEQADLRGWSLLPQQIQVVRIDAPVGTHEIALRPQRQGRLHPSNVLRGTVTVRDGHTSLVLVTFVDAEVPGTLYANQ